MLSMLLSLYHFFLFCFLVFFFLPSIGFPLDQLFSFSSWWLQVLANREMVSLEVGAGWEWDWGSVQPSSWKWMVPAGAKKARLWVQRQHTQSNRGHEPCGSHPSPGNQVNLASLTFYSGLGIGVRCSQWAADVAVWSQRHPKALPEPWGDIGAHSHKPPGDNYHLWTLEVVSAWKTRSSTPWNEGKEEGAESGKVVPEGGFSQLVVARGCLGLFLFTFLHVQECMWSTSLLKHWFLGCAEHSTCLGELEMLSWM